MTTMNHINLTEQTYHSVMSGRRAIVILEDYGFHIELKREQNTITLQALSKDQFVHLGFSANIVVTKNMSHSKLEKLITSEVSCWLYGSPSTLKDIVSGSVILAVVVALAFWVFG